MTLNCKFEMKKSRIWFMATFRHLWAYGMYKCLWKLYAHYPVQHYVHYITGLYYFARIWQSCWVGYLFFHQLRFGTEHHMKVSVIAPGWRSLTLSQFTSHTEILLLFSRRERWIFNNRGVILTLIHWLGLPFFNVAMLGIWSDRSYAS